MALMKALRSASAELPISSVSAAAVITRGVVPYSSWSAAPRDSDPTQASQSQGFATRTAPPEESDMLSGKPTQESQSRANGGLSPWSSGGHLLMRSSQWLRRVLSTDPERANEAPFAAITGTRGCAGGSHPVLPHSFAVNQLQQYQQTDSPCLASAKAVAERLSKDSARTPPRAPCEPHAGVRRPVSCT